MTRCSGETGLSPQGGPHPPRRPHSTPNLPPRRPRHAGLHPSRRRRHPAPPRTKPRRGRTDQPSRSDSHHDRVNRRSMSGRSGSGSGGAIGGGRVGRRRWRVRFRSLPVAWSHPDRSVASGQLPGNRRPARSLATGADRSSRRISGPTGEVARHEPDRRTLAAVFEGANLRATSGPKNFDSHLGGKRPPRGRSFASKEPNHQLPRNDAPAVRAARGDFPCAVRPGPGSIGRGRDAPDHDDRKRESTPES